MTLRRAVDFFDGEPEWGPYTENGTQYPGLVYSKVNIPLAIDASGISGALSPSFRARTDVIKARTSRGRCCRGAQMRRVSGEREWKPRDSVTVSLVTLSFVCDSRSPTGGILMSRGFG